MAKLHTVVATLSERVFTENKFVHYKSGPSVVYFNKSDSHIFILL